MTRTKVHYQFADHRVGLFVRSGRNGCADAMLMHVDAQDHRDDIELFPERRTKGGRKIEKGFSDTSSNELAAMLLRKCFDSLEDMMGKLRRALCRVRGDMDFVDTKVNGIVCIVHRKPNFNSRLILENSSRQSEVQFLSY